MKNILTFFLLSALFASASAQQSLLDWVELDDALCVNSTNCDENVICLGLEYTPGYSGGVSSYELPFFVDCANSGAAVTYNKSVTLYDNSRQVYGCEEVNLTLLVCAAHSGGVAVTEGVPIILHEVCFTLPAGKVVSVVEDEIADLTVGMGSVVDFPDYTTRYISAPCPSPAALLDFEVLAKQNFVSVEWTIAGGSDIDYMNVQRAGEDLVFSTIKVQQSTGNASRDKSYKYNDRDASTANSNYRIQIVYNSGEMACSEIKQVGGNQINGQNTSRDYPIDMDTYTTQDEAQVYVVNNELRFLNFDILESHDLNLYNVAGQKVFVKVHNSGDHFNSINLDGLIPGIYFLVVRGELSYEVYKVTVAI